ncbi:hypothetical protein GCM10007108_04900 [Thermogymnomonas acidicola]|uniref:Peptidase S53 domain-containing protein n=1 Tax=Thermogymnomonas acidicola TaxID=399579 RepID=A0AA37BQI7_9ARCH|nr:hypothetical protein GCM10007108_04900 [Thermogymnomonas acidicola]
MKPSNLTSLESFLASISDPYSPDYGHYITLAQFIERYAPPPGKYRDIVSYFRSFGLQATTYSSRLAIQLQGSAGQIGRAFGTDIVGDSKSFGPSSNPVLPGNVSVMVNSVIGLSSSPPMRLPLQVLSDLPGHNMSSPDTTPSGYPAPVTQSGVQYLWGPDMQVAYGERPLFNITYPFNETIVTILWAGSDEGIQVPPYDPASVESYLNLTLPSWEPRPRIVPYPVDGAPLPGPKAQYDTTGAVIENELDLEMAGSMAPGATIVNAYGPSSASNNLALITAVLTSVLSNQSALFQNLSVISNSWGTGLSTVSNSTVQAWQYLLDLAEARGITVLAASGDAADSPFSSKYSGSIANFPAALAFNYTGITSVGGVTDVLGPNLHISSASAWFEDTFSSGILGSEGGYAEQIPEPYYQVETVPASQDPGRYLMFPDISALANNTIINGTDESPPSTLVVAGTSVASPLVAGMVAEIDAVAQHMGAPRLGYINPMLFYLGADQLRYSGDSQYNSSLPLTALSYVTSGENTLYSAHYGYNLVGGWGQPVAYNISAQSLSVPPGTHRPYEMGVFVHPLNVSSGGYSLHLSPILAGTLGEPLYVINITLNATGNAVSGYVQASAPYPYTYRQHFVKEETVSAEQDGDINISLEVVNGSRPWEAQTVLNVNGDSLTINTPGASFIIDAPEQAYTAQNGTLAVSGPGPGGYAGPGELDPSISLNEGGNTDIQVSASFSTGSPGIETIAVPGEQYGPSVAEKEPFSFSTDNGYLVAAPSTSTSSAYFSVPRKLYNLTVKQGGLYAGQEWGIEIDNVATSVTSSPYMVIPVPAGNYTVSLIAPPFSTPDSSSIPLSVTGNTFQFASFTTRAYVVQFTEVGLPAGEEWNVSSFGIVKSGTGSSIDLFLPNGTYTYTAYSNNATFNAVTGTFKVSGSNVTVEVAFSKRVYLIDFHQTGLRDLTWSVDLNGTVESGNGTDLFFREYYGTYNYTVTPPPGYQVTNQSGQVVTDTPSPVVNLTFEPYHYKVTFREQGLPAGQFWGVVVDNMTISGDTAEISGNLTFGNYTVIVLSPAGYEPLSSPISVSVDRNGISVTVDFRPVESQSNVTAYGIIALAVVIAAVGAMALFRRR